MVHMDIVYISLRSGDFRQMIILFTDGHRILWREDKCHYGSEYQAYKEQVNYSTIYRSVYPVHVNDSFLFILSTSHPEQGSQIVLLSLLHQLP